MPNASSVNILLLLDDHVATELAALGEERTRLLARLVEVDLRSAALRTHAEVRALFLAATHAPTR